jgi:hypothetical protein
MKTLVEMKTRLVELGESQHRLLIGLDANLANKEERERV